MFDNANLYILSLQEEVDYAKFLNHEFILGLSQINGGVTKRAYLSGKLVCTKMRISKKFKGKPTFPPWPSLYLVHMNDITFVRCLL